MSVDITKIARVKSSALLSERFSELGYDLPVTDDFSVLATPVASPVGMLGNRFCILPMEGWDANDDGTPSELVARRWHNFAAGGASLLWGGEAAAIVPAARANPQQLVITPETAPAIKQLLESTRAAAASAGNPDQKTGLQLTHSGRWCRPTGAFEPVTMYSHAVLDARAGASEGSVLADTEVEEIAALFIERAVLAHGIGFDFVDFKHCHGYLAHEMLSAVGREGDFGGSFEARTRFTRLVLEGIRRECPGLEVGVRLSAYDFVPFTPGEDRTGVADISGGTSRFGADGSGLDVDLSEPLQFIELIQGLGVKMLCITAGSPYYNPHIQRPAMYPPSDGYQPPEDPLLGVARMLAVTREIKKKHPELFVVGTGFSYLQEYLPHVAAGLVAEGSVDAVGLGRMALSYPDMPRDVLEGRGLARKKICRTFSDCTTAPRNGLISGCFPLDPYYKKRDEAAQLKIIKSQL